MSNTNENSAKVKESEIKVAAYQKWEKAGRPAGQDMQFWLDAEAQLRASAKAVFAPPAAHVSPLEAKSVTDRKHTSTQEVLSQPKSPAPQQKTSRF